MSASPAQIERLRRMTAESGSSTYSDDDLAAAIERYPLVDAFGQPPTVGSQANAAWTPTYDLNAAAADIWDEKGAVLADRIDFSADGASFSASQAYAHAASEARKYRARRAPTTLTLRPEPIPVRDPSLGNAN